MSESLVLASCIHWLYAQGCDIIRNNTGGFMTSYTRKDGTKANYRVKVGKKGSGDIIACSPHGRWVEVECKFGYNKQSPEQKSRQVEIERRKGVYVVAYSVHDLEDRKSDILATLW